MMITQRYGPDDDDVMIFIHLNDDFLHVNVVFVNVHVHDEHFHYD